MYTLVVFFLFGAFYSIKKSSSKTENSLSDMIREGFVNIQAESAERVRDKLNKINRCVKHIKTISKQ